MNFDTVAVQRADGTQEKLTLADFAKIALPERVKLVASGKVTFYKNGQMISAVEALKKTSS